MIQPTYTHLVRSLSSLRFVPLNYIFHYLTQKRGYLPAKKEFSSPKRVTIASAAAAAASTRYNDLDIFLILGLTRTHHNRISSIASSILNRQVIHHYCCSSNMAGYQDIPTRICVLVCEGTFTKTPYFQVVSVRYVCVFRYPLGLNEFFSQLPFTSIITYMWLRVTQTTNPVRINISYVVCRSYSSSRYIISYTSKLEVRNFFEQTPH